MNWFQLLAKYPGLSSKVPLLAKYSTLKPSDITADLVAQMSGEILDHPIEPSSDLAIAVKRLLSDGDIDALADFGQRPDLIAKVAALLTGTPRKSAVQPEQSGMVDPTGLFNILKAIV